MKLQWLFVCRARVLISFGWWDLPCFPIFISPLHTLLPSCCNQRSVRPLASLEQAVCEAAGNASPATTRQGRTQRHLASVLRLAIRQPSATWYPLVQSSLLYLSLSALQRNPWWSKSVPRAASAALSYKGCVWLFQASCCQRSRTLENICCCFTEILLTAVATALSLHWENLWFLGFSSCILADLWSLPSGPPFLHLSGLVGLGMLERSARAECPMRGAGALTWDKACWISRSFSTQYALFYWCLFSL